MSAFQRLLLITFLESGSTVLIERGVFFFTDDQLKFSKEMNLALALVFALPYAVAALLSHRITHRISEKALTVWSIIGQSVFLAAVAVWPTAAMVFVAQAALGTFTGLKWPPVESYVSAGLTPTQTARRIGVFNVTWAGAVPLAVLVAGPLIAWQPRSLYVLPLLLSAVALLLLAPLASRPTHLPHDHPDRPDPARLLRIGALLVSSRWLLLTSYAAYFVLAALMPGVFSALHVDIRLATPLSSLTEIARVAMFFLLIRYVGWHDLAWPLALSIVAIPVGFVLVATGVSLPLVLAGELLFGFAMGVTYYAALYYAMVVRNAAVDAGGVHEGLIGIGFILGPLAALLGSQLGPQFAALADTFSRALGQPVDARLVGMMIGIAPVLLLGLWFAGRALWRMRGLVKAGDQESRKAGDPEM